MSRSNKKDTTPIEDDDPYARVAQESTNVLESEAQKESARQRKWNKLKQRFQMNKQALKQGFLMGSMVGGGFGLVMGIYAGIQYRSLLIVPLTAITSAASFGFFMACGTLIRTHPLDCNGELNLLTYNLKEQTLGPAIPMWQMKYMKQYM